MTFLTTRWGEMSYDHLKPNIGSQFRNPRFPLCGVVHTSLLIPSQDLWVWLRADGWRRRRGLLPPPGAASWGPGGGCVAHAPGTALPSGVCWELTPLFPLLGTDMGDRALLLPGPSSPVLWEKPLILRLTDALLRCWKLSSPHPATSLRLVSPSRWPVGLQQLSPRKALTPLLGLTWGGRLVPACKMGMGAPACCPITMSLMRGPHQAL